MSAAIAVTKDMIAEGNVPALSFVSSHAEDQESNPKGTKRKKTTTQTA